MTIKPESEWVSMDARPQERLRAASNADIQNSYDWLVHDLAGFYEGRMHGCGSKPEQMFQGSWLISKEMRRRKLPFRVEVEH